MTDTTKHAAPLLEALVRAYSPSGQEAEAGKVLVDHLDQLGLTAYRDAAGNAIARGGSTGEAAPTILLLGHIDTVPGELDVAWEGDRLTGRGTVDAKGPLTAHALALAALDEDLPARVVLAGAVGEEATSRGARHLIDTLDPPDALLIAEPTGVSTVGLGYKGRVVGHLETVAEPAHAGAPDATASERLLDGIDALTAWTGNPDRDVGVDATTLRIVGLDTHHGTDVETASARVDLRLPGEVPEAAELAKTLPSGVELDVDEAVPAVRADPRNPVATALRGALTSAGIDHRAAVKTGTSDWNHAHAAWRCPGVAYGPGDPTLDHTPHEAIALDEVETASRVLEAAIEQLARRLDDGV